MTNDEANALIDNWKREQAINNHYSAIILSVQEIKEYVERKNNPEEDEITE